jgi:hypothetical protein
VVLMEALGTADLDFLNGLLRQLTNLSTNRGEVNERDLNFMLAVVRGIEPQDQLETMLAAQMAAIHNATMTFARRLNHVDTIPQQDSTERALNKLARTFTTQMETLKKYRTGGEQKVTVQHVTVTDNAQAIVGNVSAGGGMTRKSETNPSKRVKAVKAKQSDYAFQKAPRCTATSKRTKQRCRAPAVRGWKSAGSTERAEAHPRVRPTVLGSTDVIARPQSSSAS